MMIDGLKVIPILFRYHDKGRRLSLPFDVSDIREAIINVDVLRPNAISAWYRVISPIRMTCTDGAVKLVVFDARRKGPTFGEIMAFVIGEHQVELLALPEGVMVGYQNLHGRESTLLSLGSGEDLSEVLAPENDLIPYQW